MEGIGSFINKNVISIVTQYCGWKIPKVMYIVLALQYFYRVLEEEMIIGNHKPTLEIRIYPS